MYYNILVQSASLEPFLKGCVLVQPFSKRLLKGCYQFLHCLLFYLTFMGKI
jgi:hypothetical protein